MNIYSQFRRAN